MSLTPIQPIPHPLSSLIAEALGFLIVRDIFKNTVDLYTIIESIKAIKGIYVYTGNVNIGF